MTIEAAAQHLPPPGRPEEMQARARRRRGERLRMLGLVFVSYLFDSGMLGMLGLAGAMDPLAAGYYALGGAAACLGFYLALRGGWSERFQDPYLTSAQIVTASTLQLVVAWLAPQVGALLLCSIFLVFSFSALRLTLRQLVPVWAAVSLGIVAVVLLSGKPLALPAATPWQAVLSGLWVSFAVGRCAFVGLYGASVRELLGSRNRELAAAQGRLQDLASRDELTGALNRRAIMGIVSEHLERRRQGGPAFAVAGLQVTMSAGLAFADGASGLEQLLQRADEALYAAKSGGRNRVCTAAEARQVTAPA